MRLGEMLVRDGRLSQVDLDATITRQTSEGGRLGSLLVESSLIDAETLTVYLGLELGIPVANGGALERCKKSAVSLLTNEQAAKYRCIPIVIQGQTLMVAVHDPHDVMLLDALAATTGYRIIPRVAPEIRILYYLERFYGIARPARYAALGEKIRGQRELKPEHRTLPNPPLPGLPPIVESPLTPSKPAEPLRKRSKSAPPPLPQNGPSAQVRTDASALNEKLDADATETAAPTGERVRLGTQPITNITSVQGPVDVLDIEAALENLDSVTNHGAIANTVLQAALNTFETAVVCLVRDNMLLGWKGVGPGLNEDRVECISIPLEPPSIFQEAIAETKPFSGRAFPTIINTHWFHVLQTNLVEHSYVFVVRIGKRPVNVVYGHKESGDAAHPEQLANFCRVLDAASAAYVRLISKRKETEY